MGLGFMWGIIFSFKVGLRKGFKNNVFSPMHFTTHVLNQYLWSEKYDYIEFSFVDFWKDTKNKHGDLLIF